MKPRKRLTSRTLSAALSPLVIAALVMLGAQPAVASITTLTGTQAPSTVVHWDTPRTNYNTRNLVSIRVHNSNLTAGLRNTAGTQFGDVTEIYMVWKNFYVTSTGQTWFAPGTFYMNTGWWGGTTGTWTANFQWNIAY